MMTIPSTTSSSIIYLTDLAEWFFGIGCLVLFMLFMALHKHWCSLAQVTFVSTSGWLVLTLGGFIDALISHDQLSRWMLESSPSSWLKCLGQWTTLFVSIVLSTAFVLNHHHHHSRVSSSSSSMISKPSSLLGVYLYGFSLSFLLLGCRWNARVRHSALTPGPLRSCHWVLMTKVVWILVLHCMTLTLIQLYGFLLSRGQHTLVDVDRSDISFIMARGSENSITDDVLPRSRSTSWDKATTTTRRDLNESWHNRKKEGQHHQHQHQHHRHDASRASSGRRHASSGRRARSGAGAGKKKEDVLAGNVAAWISSDSDDDVDDPSDDDSPEIPAMTDHRWTKCRSDRGIYYYCEETGESRWDCPSTRGASRSHHPKWD